MNTSRADVDARARAISKAASDWLGERCFERDSAIRETLALPNTFTSEAIREAIRLSMGRLDEQDLLAWVGPVGRHRAETVAVLNAGNVPLVGLQDFLAVWLTGHRYLGILSGRSPYLLPAFAETARRYYTDSHVQFVSLETAADEATVLLATGSDTTVQIISHRFVKAGVPEHRQLLRKTRLGVAVLNGLETHDDFRALAKDVLLHEGRGCRSVAVILAPDGLAPDRFLEEARRFRIQYPTHPLTSKCVERTARFLRAVGATFVIEDGMILAESDVMAREPCLVRWIRCESEADVSQWLQRNEYLVQVVVARDDWEGVIPETADRGVLGSAQDPRLGWCPDGLDTIAFLKRVA